MIAPTCISLLLRRLFQIYCVILAHPFANTTFVLFEVKTAFINICNKGNCLSEVYMDGFIHSIFPDYIDQDIERGNILRR